jgi:subtilase family serine protease
MTTPTADSDKYSTGILVRRLLMEVALTHWRLYAIGFALMLVAAAATAATAYLLGTMINETVVTHNFRGIVFVSIYAFRLHWSIMPIYVGGIILLGLLTSLLSKKIKVIVNYANASTFTDKTKCKATALAQIARGSKVIFADAG